MRMPPASEFDNDPARESFRSLRPVSQKRPNEEGLTPGQCISWRRYLRDAEAGESSALRAGACHHVRVRRLDGPVDARALSLALDGVVARHEALRLQLDPEAGVQRVLPELRWPLLDSHACDDARQQAARSESSDSLEDGPPGSGLRLEGAVEAFARAPFAPTGALGRAALIETRAGAERYLVLVVHPAVADSVSVSIVWAEWATLYEAAVDGKGASGPPPPASQWSDFCLARNALMQTPQADACSVFWREQVRGLPHPFPSSRAEGDAQRGCDLRLELLPGLCAQLSAQAETLDVTPFMVLLTAYCAQLYLESGLSLWLVNTPVARRGEARFASLVGALAGNLLLRVECVGGSSLRQLLQQVQRLTVAAYDNQSVTPADALGEGAAPSLTATRFVLEEEPEVFQVADSSWVPVELPLEPVQGINLRVFRREGGLRLRLQCGPEWGQARSAQFLRDYEGLLWRLGDQLDTPLEVLPQSAARARHTPGRAEQSPTSLSSPGSRPLVSGSIRSEGSESSSRSPASGNFAPQPPPPASGEGSTLAGLDAPAASRAEGTLSPRQTANKTSHPPGREPYETDLDERGDSSQPQPQPSPAAVWAPLDLEPASALPLSRPEIAQPLPLSATQHRRFARPVDRPSTLVMRVALAGQYDERCLAQALTAVGERRDALRLRFEREARRQCLAPLSLSHWAFRTLQLGSALEWRQVDTEVCQPFPLSSGPLARAAIVQTPSGQPDALVLALHEWVADARSGQLLLEDLGVLYDGFVAGRVPELPPVGSFQDWLEARVGLPAALAEQAEYWQAQPWARAERHWRSAACTADRPKFAASTLGDKLATELLARADLEERLLAALVFALRKCLRLRAIGIDLEADGRKSRVGRSLPPGSGAAAGVFGPCCVHYPLFVQAGAGRDSLPEVREAFHALPHGGASFGELRYRSAHASSLQQLPYPKAAFRMQDLRQLPRSVGGLGQQVAGPLLVGVEAVEPLGVRLSAVVDSEQVCLQWAVGESMAGALDPESLHKALRASLQRQLAGD